MAIDQFHAKDLRLREAGRDRDLEVRSDRVFFDLFDVLNLCVGDEPCQRLMSYTAGKRMTELLP